MKDSVEQELARDGSAVRIRAPRARHAIDFTTEFPFSID